MNGLMVDRPSNGTRWLVDKGGVCGEKGSVERAAYAHHVMATELVATF